MFCVMVWLREGVSRSILRGGFLDEGGGRETDEGFFSGGFVCQKFFCRSIRFDHVAVSLGLYEERGSMDFNQFVLVFFGYLLECRVEMNQAMGV